MKKTFSILGIIVCCVIAFLGILVLAGKLGGEQSFAGSPAGYYDSGYATFGGDFYSYVNNNAATAAVRTGAIVNNLNGISSLLKNVCGISMIGFGLIGICLFGIFCSSTNDTKNNAADPMPSDEAVAPFEIGAFIGGDNSQSAETPSEEQL